MGLYTEQIRQLQELKADLEETKADLEQKIAETTDPSLRNVYQGMLEETIDDIDEVDQAIEILETKAEGTPNGYDKHSEEIDWTNPDNWKDVREIFGFDDDESQINENWFNNLLRNSYIEPMTLIDQLQIQLAILQSYLIEMIEMHEAKAEMEELLALKKRMAAQREVRKKLIKKTVGIAKMRDIPVRSMN